MEEVRVIDYGKSPESELKEIIELHGGEVTDWMEKDYGVIVYINIPSHNVTSFCKAIRSHSNYDLNN